jgi:hypothetical protein
MGYRLFRRPQISFLCVIVFVCLGLLDCGIVGLWVCGLVGSKNHPKELKCSQKVPHAYQKEPEKMQKGTKCNQKEAKTIQREAKGRQKLAKTR